jgi:hypothetical protein
VMNKAAGRQDAKSFVDESCEISVPLTRGHDAPLADCQRR